MTFVQTYIHHQENQVMQRKQVNRLLLHSGMDWTFYYTDTLLFVVECQHTMLQTHSRKQLCQKTKNY